MTRWHWRLLTRTTGDNSNGASNHGKHKTPRHSLGVLLARLIISDPYGTRTRVAGVKGRCPNH